MAQKEGTFKNISYDLPVDWNINTFIYFFFSLFYEPREFFTRITEIQNCKKGGVAIATGWSVTKLDVINKIAYLEDGHEIKFDKCLIAVGK